MEIWQASETLDEVAQKLGNTKTNCSSRAAQLRRKGVLLKKFREYARLDVNALNRLCEES